MKSRRTKSRILRHNTQPSYSKAIEAAKSIYGKTERDETSDFQAWKERNRLVDRSDIDDKTLRNIYEAIDEKDR